MSQEQSIEQQREALRARNQVCLLKEEEEGLPIDDVSPGVYGFAHAPGSESMPLFRRQTYLAFEVHKRANGEVDVLGFLGKEEAAAVEAGEGDMEILLFSDPTAEKSVLISIPTERILHVKDMSNRDAKGLNVQVAGFR